ncbi:hypothetical protein [Hyphococcus sp.]|uniref:hypothetical protein n=1 Tax=Hyphococcus sp. TaxID=2038636 RepID=UPI002080B7E8|nr:MAG: hypothetical protein DHS20C04_06840 [Marinicaulis sp.]
MGNLVEVARFYDPEEAYCAKSFLLSNGIDSFVQNDHYLTMAPWMRIALHGYGLQVTASSEEEATQLLRSVAASQPTPEVSLMVNDAGDDDFRNEKKAPNWLWFPVALGTFIPFMPKRKSGVPAIFQHSALLALYLLVLSSATYWMMWVFSQI